MRKTNKLMEQIAVVKEMHWLMLEAAIFTKDGNNYMAQLLIKYCYKNMLPVIIFIISACTFKFDAALRLKGTRETSLLTSILIFFGQRQQINEWQRQWA